MLIAVGTKASINRSEKYEIKSNKWIQLPHLKKTKFGPALAILPSKRVFCFCGYPKNSIEKLESGVESEWQILPTVVKLSRRHSGVVLLESRIMIFQGI